MTNNSEVLCLVTDKNGQVFLHADAKGLDMLIKSLQQIRKKIDENICDHNHFMTEAWGGSELTEIRSLDRDWHICHHLKVFGWTDEWAKKHGFLDK